MARLCIPGSRVETLIRLSNGHYDLTSVTTEFQRAFIRIHDDITNSSQFIIELSTIGCIKSLAKNETDIVTSLAPLDEQADYFIPAPGRSTSVEFMAGLSDANYTEAHGKPNVPKYGLMSNVHNFTVDTWSVIIIFAAIFVSLALLKSYSMKTQLALLGRQSRRPLRSIFVLNCRHLVDGRATKLKFVCFLIHALYFLLATPFLLMFKTNQLVVVTPFVINNYERAIESNVAILSPAVATNETRFLVPNEINVARDDIVARFWEFYLMNHVAFDLKSIISGDMSPFIRCFIQAQSIFMSDLTTISLFKSVFCSYAVNKGWKIRLFTYHDVNQREEVQGIPFRKGYTNPTAMKRYRRVMEMDTFYRIAFDTVQSTGKQFLSDRDEKTLARFEICFSPETLDSQTKKAISSGSIHLFAWLLNFTYIFYFIAFLLLVVERIVGRKFRRRRRKTKRAHDGHPINHRSTFDFTRVHGTRSM